MISVEPQPDLGPWSLTVDRTDCHQVPSVLLFKVLMSDILLSTILCLVLLPFTRANAVSF